MDGGRESGRGDSVTLTAMGITLLGVLLSIGVSVGFGLHGSWWWRVAGGLLAMLLIGAAVKLGTASRRGPVARLAKWMMSGGP